MVLMTDPDQLHEMVGSRLARAGQRYTDGRRNLVGALADQDGPLSMSAILERVPDMPQSSAYRHLTVLAASGVVHRIAGTEDVGFFELTDELSGRHHHHVLCGECGSVGDIESSEDLEDALAQAARLTAERTGYAIDAHRIDLVGTCPNCLSASGAPVRAD